MINKNVGLFYQELSKYPELTKSLKEKIEKYNFSENEKNTVKLFIEKEVLPIAREKGFNFSVDELFEYEKEFKEEGLRQLTDEELMDVTGGVSLRKFSAQLMFVLTVGSAVQMPITAFAKLDPSAVSQSYTYIHGMEPQKQETQQVNVQDQVNNQTPDFSSKNVLNQDSLIEKKAIESAADSIKNMNDQNIDWEYMKHLDLEIGSVALNTGLVENFRFNNGYITNITIDENNKRDWKKDAGEGSANIMTSLFPSSAGTLSSSGGYINPFSDKIHPTPEFMAQLIGIVYDMRSNNDLYKSIVDNSKIPDKGTLLNDLLNRYKSDKNVLKTIIEKLNLNNKIKWDKPKDSELNLENITSILEEAKTLVKENGSDKGNLNKLISFLGTEIMPKMKIENLYKLLEKQLGSQDKKIIGEPRTLLNKLLKNINIMITTQECAGDNPDAAEIKAQKFLPKYTLERMILAYFVDHFNKKEDVQNFYKALEPLIKCTKADQGNVTNKQNAMGELEKLHKIYEKSSSAMTSLYKSDLISNGRAQILKNDGKGNIEITKDDFSDCGETSARHVVNLMTYDSTNKNFPLCEPKKEDTKKYLENLNELKDKINKNEKDEINKNETFEFKNLQDRLNLFYLHQTADKANNGETMTRTLWNYVIGNMDQAQEDLYALKYVNKENPTNEFSSGFVNALKLYYNIAYALKNGENYGDAKKAIDELATALKDGKGEEAKGKLKDALEKTLKLFNPKYQINVTTNDLSVNSIKNDFMGCAAVEITTDKNETFNFKIYQQQGHAYIQQDVKKNIELDEKEKEFLSKNQDAALLYSWANDDQNQEENLNDFNFKFSKPNNIKNDQSSFWKKVDALNSFRFIERQRGIEGNSKLIFDYLKTNKISLEEVEKTVTSQSDLASFIYNVIDDKDDFIYRYVVNNEFTETNSYEYQDKFIDKTAENLIKPYKSIYEIIKKDNISKEDLIKITDIEDLFKIFKDKSLISKAIDQLNDNDFKGFINNIQDNNGLREKVVCDDLSAFEYAVKTNQFEKAKLIDNKLGEKYNDKIISHDEEGNKYTALGWLVKNNQIDFILNNQNKFKLDDIVYIDKQNQNYRLNEYLSNKIKGNLKVAATVELKDFECLDQRELFALLDGDSILSLAIDKLEKSKFGELIDKLIKGLQGKGGLSIYPVFAKDDQSLNAFEYAVKMGEFDKAAIIADKLDRIIAGRNIVNKDEKGNQYSAIGYLIKEGRSDILINNKEKFDFLSVSCVYKNSDGQEYSLNEYLSNIHKDKALEEKLNPNKDIKKQLLSDQNELSLDDLKELSPNELIEIKGNKTILSMAIKKLSENDFSTFIDKIPGEILYYTVSMEDDTTQFNAFEYAIKIGEFNNAGVIAKKLKKDVNRIICKNMIKDESGDQYSAIGYLIKEGRSDILINNKEKFDFSSGYVYKNSEGREYKLNEYLSDIHKDAGLEQIVNDQKPALDDLL